VKAFRSHAAGGLSPAVAEPDDKRQKAGSALAPFKVPQRAEAQMQPSPAASDPLGDL
jgi:hypothetical protein